MTDLPRLLEQLHAGCGGSFGCQLLHQQAAEALAGMRKALEGFESAFVAAKNTAWQSSIPPASGVIIDRNAWRLLKLKAARARQALQDTPTLTGPEDGALIYAAARAMAEYDWKDELVRDVWEELHPWEQEYYLNHARIARGGTAVKEKQ